jgi:hypothetical protein
MMRVKLTVALLAVLLAIGLGRPVAADGWDQSDVARGVVHVPTAVYVPAPFRHKRCGRRFHPRCHAHSFVVYRYEGTGFPRYHYRWRGYGWNR